MAITSILLAMQFGLDFEVVEMDFADVDDAIDWLRKNQLGKRNLTENQQVFLAGDLYNRSKRLHGGDRKSEGSSVHDEHLKTEDLVAEEIKVSPETVRRAGQFAQVLEVIREKTGAEIGLENRMIDWPLMRTKNGSIEDPFPQQTIRLSRLCCYAIVISVWDSFQLVITGYYW